MIDLHCHILPDIDDGAENLEESVAMCLTGMQTGITAAVLTPHFARFDRLDAFLGAREARMEALYEALQEENADFEIYTGAEVYLSDAIASAPWNLDALTLNGSRYLLTEFSLPTFSVTQGFQWLEEVLMRGYTPILAHPERYEPFLENNDLVNELYGMGVRFQVNLDGLGGRYGEIPQDFAVRMVLEGMADFAATDAHSVRYRRTDLLSKLSHLPEDFPQERLDRILEEAPERVLRNETLPENGSGRM